jgi:hypothetical protein
MVKHRLNYRYYLKELKMEFDYCISNPAFNVAEGNNIAGTGGNTTLYKTATRNDFDNRLKNGGTLINITLKGIIPDLISGYFKNYQVNFIHLMDNIDVWPYNTCFFSVSKLPRTSVPIILGGLAAKIFTPNPDECFPFTYYSGSNKGMDNRFSAGKNNKVIRQLPGRRRDEVLYDYTDESVAAGPKFAFYVLESKKSYTVTSDPIYGGTICYISTSTLQDAEKLKLFVEKNPILREYTNRMKLRGHAFGLRNVRKFDLSQIVTGLETPAEWGIVPTDVEKPVVLDNNITEDRDRVKALGEVFTPTSLVNYVLAFMDFDTTFLNKDNTFIDSMCGDGQFLIGIVERKISNNIPADVALSTTYGIDLTKSNIVDCMNRLKLYNNHNMADNILCADSLGITLSKNDI